MEDKYRFLWLFVLMVLLSYVSYLVLKPFLAYLLLGLILAFLVMPAYRWLSRFVYPTLSAVIIVILVLLVIVLPTIWLGSALLVQAGNAYMLAQQAGIPAVATSFASHILQTTDVDVNGLLLAGMNMVQSTVERAIPSIISGTSEFLIGMVVLFLVLYYALRDGDKWYDYAASSLPLQPSHKRQLLSDIERTTKALCYGQILTAVLQGIGCGLLFALFGISNPVFWGFIVMIFAFLPFVGTPLVYGPAGIILIMQDHWIAGIGLIIASTAVLLVVDYYVRPLFVSKSAVVHPILVIIGALGGIYVFGFVGFIIGPLVLTLFLTLLGFVNRFRMA